MKLWPESDSKIRIRSDGQRRLAWVTECRTAAGRDLWRRRLSGAPGPLLIVAGAGSGKTNTLAHRVAWLIVSGADPRRMLLLTFSRRAAAEMTRRVERIIAGVPGFGAAIASAALTWAGTFHAIGARLLRGYADQIGISPDFTIHDREDSADLMNLARHELGFSKTRSRFPTKGTCLQIYSRAVNSECAIGEVLAKAFPWCASWEAELKELFAAYVEAKQRQHVLDYDDLLLYWAQTLSEPAMAADMGSRFDHILVDEYQDTNRLQSAILLALKPSGRGVTVVGDDAQSIYSFRAATVRNILDFPNAFSPPAEIITLDRNYRSTKPILAAANAVIDLAAERFTKNLWSDRASDALPELVSVADEAEQARFVAEEILENREQGTALKAQAVLFRSSHHSAALELELTRRNIPFVKYGGLKFLDAAHVKDVLACLRFAENPRDRVAGFRVLQLLAGLRPGSCGPRARPVGPERLFDRRARRYSRAAAGERRLAGLWRADAAPAQAKRRMAGRAEPRSATGTSRTWNASTTMLRSAPRISCSSSRSRQAIRRASGF